MWKVFLLVSYEGSYPLTTLTKVNRPQKGIIFDVVSQWRTQLWCSFISGLFRNLRLRKEMQEARKINKRNASSISSMVNTINIRLVSRSDFRPSCSKYNTKHILVRTLRIFSFDLQGDGSSIFEKKRFVGRVRQCYCLCADLQDVSMRSGDWQKAYDGRDGAIQTIEAAALIISFIPFKVKQLSLTAMGWYSL